MTEKDPLNVIGQVVAEKYRIERCVGEGGFAIVYRAEHTIWKRPVAIKFFNALSSLPIDQRDHFQSAFIQEGALLTELSSLSAGIVQARDVGTFTTPDGGWTPFMVLEWLEGRPLDEILDREQRAGRAPWSLLEVARLLCQAAISLDIAHGRGVAHRDIKPANLFVLGEDPRAEGATLKVLDFGVAKMMTDNTEFKAALAKTGMNVTSFTPQYGAPEQFSRSLGATGPWTDVYALALVAVEMLCGRPPLEGDDVLQLAYVSADPKRRPTPRALGVDVPDAVEAVFLKALAVSPQERYARVAEFWSALESAAGVPVNSRSAATSPQGPQAWAASLAPKPAPAHAATLLADSGSASAGSVASSPAITRGNASVSVSGIAAPKRSSRLGTIALLVASGAGALGAWFYWQRGRASESSAPAQVSVQAAAALPPPVASAVPAPSCPERMATVPAGQFFQGSDAKDALDNERPAHQVKLDAFCIDLHEVTTAEYKACSDIGKCKRAGDEAEWPGIKPADRKIYSPLCNVNDASRGDHPINCVTWQMADLYCKAQDKRLPTESEWEYATRGPDGRVYPWGDEAPTEKHLNACGLECQAWGKKHGQAFEALYAADDGFPTTAPVGRFEAGRSRFGPYDVVGNVWEWVADWDGKYSADARDNPAGPEQGERKVIRGGAWNGSYTSWLRPSFRYAQDPNARSHGIGFRCARAM